MKIKKFILLFLAISILLISASFYLINKGNPVSNLLMENHTKKYLTENGYIENDIKSIEAEFDLKRSNGKQIKSTVAYVVFKDEPNLTYKYIQSKDSNKVQQSCDILQNRLSATVKHLDSKCTEM